MPHTPYHYPYYPPSPAVPYPYDRRPLKEETLAIVEPFVQYGLREARATSVPHAMREVAAISYLIGRGIDPGSAYWLVESWEINERFY